MSRTVRAASTIGWSARPGDSYASSGELLGAYGLDDELMAKTVRVRDGVPAVTDGPYIEAKEFVSSFFLLDVDSEKRALEIAAECS